MITDTKIIGYYMHSNTFLRSDIKVDKIMILLNFSNPERLEEALLYSRALLAPNNEKLCFNCSLS